MHVVLSDALYFASGSKRDVYIHPEDNTLCIKIQKVEDNQNLNEERFFKTHNNVRILPKYSGSVQTNLGKGLVVELIRDFDGNVSKSLHDYISSRRISAEDAHKHIDYISHELLKKKVLIHDGNLKNIILRKTVHGSLQPILVDGFGVRNQNLKYFLRDKISLLSIKKTKQQLDRMRHYIAIEHNKLKNAA
ncbi:YrbL family protein [Vibrio sp. CDRSL-10 TSBA]